MRSLSGALAVLLVLSACAPDADRADQPHTGQTHTGQTHTDQTQPDQTQPDQKQADRTQAPSSAASDPPHPVSLPALTQREFAGRRLRLGRVRERTAGYVSHQATYRSGELTVSGVLNIPRGPGPFPAVVLAHGYIDPAVYVSGQGMTRERGVLADAGYIAFHVDYRNHGFSDHDPAAERELRLGYTEDLINAVLALRAWDGPIDPERVGLVGRSMGGGVVYNVLTVMPGLVGAAVAFAPVSSLAAENFDRWVRHEPSRKVLARQILRKYGEPGRAGGFWRDVSPRSFFGRATEPLMIHHGTLDDSCPISWSEETVRAWRAAGNQVIYHVYPGEGHAFGPQFDISMRRTIRFLDREL